MKIILSVLLILQGTIVNLSFAGGSGTPSQQSNGILVPLADGKSILAYCGQNTIVVKTCGPSSTYPIHKQSDCVGIDRNLSTNEFYDLMRSAATLPGLKAKLTPLTPLDVLNVQDILSPETLREQKQELEKSISGNRVYLQQMSSSLDETTKTSLNKKIWDLEEDGYRLDAKLTAAKKRDQLISTSIQDICTKTIAVPAKDTYLYSALQSFDPKKYACGGLANCDQSKMIAGKEWFLILRDGSCQGSIEYWMDLQSNTIIVPKHFFETCGDVPRFQTDTYHAYEYNQYWTASADGQNCVLKINYSIN